MKVATCPFCRDLNSETGGANIVIARKDGLAVLADLAPIVEGHVLVSPLEHYTSLANTPARLRDQIFDVARAIMESFAGQGLESVLSEHGTGHLGGPSNACCDHAHLHIIPLPRNVRAEQLLDSYERRGGPPQSVGGAEVLSTLESKPYNLIGANADQMRYWSNIEQFFPQFFRNVACQAVGYSQGDRRYLWQSSIDKSAAARGVNMSAAALRGLGARRVGKIRVVDKLVRDGVPRVIHEAGDTPIFRKVQSYELGTAATSKVKEELREFAAAPSAAEAADILEAVEKMFDVYGVKRQDIAQERAAKAAKLGRFDDHVALELVIEWADD